MVKPWVIWCSLVVDAVILGYLLMLAYLWVFKIPAGPR